MSGLLVVGIVALLAAIPLYFSSRNPHAPPSRFEAFAATAWLWFRRLLCFGFALGCFATAYAFSFGDAVPRDGRSAAPVIVFAILFGAFAIYVGIVGQGPHRTRLRDDVELHRRNRERYRWWF